MALIGALCSLCAAGCGSTGGPVASTNARAAQLLTVSEVDSAAAGSPARALLEWWRAIQYADLTGYLSGFDRTLRQLRTSTGAGENELTILNSQLRNVRPIVRDTLASGRTATVYTVIAQRAPLGARVYTTTDSPQAFAMVQEDGGWKIADATFVLQRVGPVLDREGRRQAGATAPRNAGLPSVVGLDLAVARLELFGLGMVARPLAVSSSAPSGTVVSQDPGPKAKIPRGSVVTLRVASGA